MVTALLLARPYTTENLTGGKGPNVKPPVLPRHSGDNQKVIALHLSPAIPRLFPVGGGGGGVAWIQMTGALIVHV